MHDLVALPGAGDDGRLVEESTAGPGPAAGRDLDVRFGGRARHDRPQPFALRVRHQRPHLNARLLLLSELDGSHRLRQIGDHALVDAFTDVHAAGGGAILPGVVEAEGADTRDHLGHIGIVEYDHRRLATELQMGTLEVAGRGRQYLLAGGDRPGQRYRTHARAR